MTLDVHDEASSDPIRTAVGRSIHTARQQAGLSMREFASQCGVSQPFISTVERGISTPSIATLYRMAEVLGIEPSELLPSHPTADIDIIRAGDGQLVPSSDRPGSAVGRVLLSDPDRHLEIYEYITDATEDLDVWYEHPGDVVLHLIEGALRVEFTGRPDAELAAGDCLVHPGGVPHRWTVLGDATVRLFLVITRP